MKWKYYFNLLIVVLFVDPLLAQLSPAEIYEGNSGSVVLLLSFNPGNNYHSKGTGSIISKGRVLTNAHVVLDEEGKPFSHIRVYLLHDNANDDAIRKLKHGKNGQIRQMDINLDLALVEVKGLENVEPIPLGDSSNIAIGDPVLAIGHPENGGLWSLTSGRIGAKIRNQGGIRGRHVFQTEASLNRGNSGGPLLNYWGQLIGVNTSIVRKASDGLAITGINFSIQSNVARKWLEDGGLRVATVTDQRKNSDVDARLIGAEKKERKTNPRIIPESDSDGLLTKPRPFRDQDLTDSFFEKQNGEFESFVEKQNNDFERMLNSQDAQFDSLFKTGQ